MLYLIEDRDYLKIGYTANLDSRIKTYKTHNPHAVLLSSKDGNRLDEKNLHALCKEYQYDSEGFHNKDEVKQIFADYTTIAGQDGNKVKSIIDNILKEFKSRLEDSKFGEPLDGSTYSGKNPESEKLCNFIFKETAKMEKPQEYAYYFNAFNSITKIMYNSWYSTSIYPIDIINALSTANYLSKEELNTYNQRLNDGKIRSKAKAISEIDVIIKEEEENLILLKEKRERMQQEYNLLIAKSKPKEEA